jgi:fatty-acid desaturase
MTKNQIKALAAMISIMGLRSPARQWTSEKRQHERFIETAREPGCYDDEAALKRS